MYQKPEGLTQELLLENQKLKSKVTEQRFKIQDLEKEIEQYEIFFKAYSMRGNIKI